MTRIGQWLISGLLLVVIGAPAAESTHLAVLDFELNDLTLDPGTPEELERTASLRPLLEQALIERPGLSLVQIPSTSQQAADRGVGYLFEHPEAAAELAATSGADYVVVGRLHKPSFLFAYLKAHLVDVRSGRVVGDYVVEVKGAQPALTQRGVEALAEDIGGTLQLSAVEERAG